MTRLSWVVLQSVERPHTTQSKKHSKAARPISAPAACVIEECEQFFLDESETGCRFTVNRDQKTFVDNLALSFDQQMEVPASNIFGTGGGFRGSSRASGVSDEASTPSTFAQTHMGPSMGPGVGVSNGDCHYFLQGTCSKVTTQTRLLHSCIRL